jgi:hypothetical protein
MEFGVVYLNLTPHGIFCRQEKLKDMAPMRAFMQWVVDWLDRELAESAKSPQT